MNLFIFLSRQERILPICDKTSKNQLKKLRNQKLSNSPSDGGLEAKKRQLQQEYQKQKAESSHGTEQLFQEYENKFKEIAVPLANLIPEIQKQLAKLGYKKLIIRWKQGEQFGRIHLTTLEPSVIFEVEKN